MQLWYLTPSSISYLAQFILTLAIAAYLAQLVRRLWKQKTEWLPTALLAGFFAGWTLFSFLAFSEVSLHPGLRLLALYWQSPVVALGLVFLLQFVYHFPAEPPTLVWESRIALGLSLLYLLWESAYAVERLELLADWNVQYRVGMLDEVLIIEFLWILVVALRQTVRASNHARSQAQNQVRSEARTLSEAILSLTGDVLTRLRSAPSLTPSATSLTTIAQALLRLLVALIGNALALSTNALHALVFPYGRRARGARFRNHLLGFLPPQRT
jgi:hypothetical protein